MTRFAFLGLGAMGSRMAANLLAAGMDVTVWNRTWARASELQRQGAKVADNPAAAAEQADIVISMVRDDEASKDVWLGDDGALGAMTTDAIGVECSTLTLSHVAHLSDSFAEMERGFVDAPLAGSLMQAENAQLIFLCGGEASNVNAARPAFETMGNAVHHIGGAGSGAAVKLMVNALLGIQLAAGAELLGFAQRVGLDLGVASDVLGSVPVCSPALKGSMSAMVARQFAPSFPIDLVAKDFDYLARSAAGVDSAIPVGETVGKIFRQAKEADLAAQNITAVARLYLSEPA